jgi:Na+-driven multidrug efflux pump
MAMNLSSDNIHHLYLRFLANAFGAALVASIFGVVDMAMMGHYQGPDGPAALAIISPIWNLVYSLGLLTGIGSSVLYSAKKGDEEETEDPNQYFTIGLILTGVIAVIEAVLLNVFLEQLLVFFGANETTLPLCLAYLFPVRFGFPLFTLSNFLAAFLRNDKAPGLATAGVVSGGLFNIIFDYIFIFVCNMGMQGAGLATILGMILGLLIMSSHFLSKKNTLKLVRFHDFGGKSSRILTTGFSSFFVDAAMGIVNIAFNRQIIALYPSEANSYLSIYGVLLNLYVFMQCASYGIGQAAQPLLSFNYGAKLYSRVKSLLKDALFTVSILSAVGLVLSESIPTYLIRLFMTPSSEVLSLAPEVMRPFCLCFVLLSFNVVSCYYFQAILQDKAAFFVSLFRGAIIPVIILFTLPYLQKELLWYTMGFTEVLTGIATSTLLIVFTKRMSKNTPQVKIQG